MIHFLALLIVFCLSDCSLELRFRSLIFGYSYNKLPLVVEPRYQPERQALDIVRNIPLDGWHIATGSNDKTIRKWVAETGSVSAQPLKGVGKRAPTNAGIFVVLSVTQNLTFNHNGRDSRFQPRSRGANLWSYEPRFSDALCFR